MMRFPDAEPGQETKPIWTSCHGIKAMAVFSYAPHWVYAKTGEGHAWQKGCTFATKRDIIIDKFCMKGDEPGGFRNKRPRLEAKGHTA